MTRPPLFLQLTQVGRTRRCLDNDKHIVVADGFQFTTFVEGTTHCVWYLTKFYINALLLYKLNNYNALFYIYTFFKIIDTYSKIIVLDIIYVIVTYIFS